VDVLQDSDRLAALRATGLLDTLPEESFDRVTRLARRLLQTPVSLVSLVDADRQFFKSQSGLAGEVAQARGTPLSYSFCQHVVSGGAPLVIGDAQEHALVRDNPAVHELGVQAYLGVPLRARDGHVLGSLCVIDSERRAWSDADVATIRDLADIVMTEILLRQEVSLREQAEAAQALLTGELQHRVKNTVATVQALVNLSLRDADSLEGVRTRLGARLAALAKTHDLIFGHATTAARLRPLIESELGYFNDDSHTRINLSGPDAVLSSQTAVTLGLVLHELTTNASKYGSLSVPQGRLDLRWSVDGDESDRLLSLHWHESGGPTVVEPARLGFGFQLVRRLVTAAGGEAVYDFAPAGLRLEIRARVGRAS
jgi:two-component sensor histidine kinase